MHITILCTGSHGDIRPYVALGVGLKKKGHQVRLIADPHAQDLCSTFALDFLPLDGELASLLHASSQKRKSIKDSLKFTRHILKQMSLSLEKQLKSLPNAIKGTDAIVYHPAVMAVEHVAELLNVPAYSFLLMPEVRTKHHMSCVFPPKTPFGKVGNFLSHLLTEQFFWQPMRQKINRWRSLQGISKINFFGPAFRKHEKSPILVAISPSLFPRPKDWKPHVHMTGFARLKTVDVWHPPKELLNFLNKGAAPLYLGFGSLSEVCPKNILESMIAVLKKLDVRVLLSGNFPEMQNIKLPENMFWIKSAPHDWLFERVAAVVHHGGAGTTAACLYAGRPNLIMPFILDQFHWGKRIYDLKIGPKPISINRYNEKVFENAVKKLLTENDFRINAEKLALKLNEEDGVENAIALLEKELKRKGYQSP